MEWDWVRGYPIFAYMNWIEHGRWDVKVVRGVKGNQKLGNTSPKAPSWFKFKTTNCISKSNVFGEVIKQARWRIKREEKHKGEVVA